MASKDELQHAILYATEETRIYMFNKYRNLYTDWFGYYSDIVTRPATPDDYYIPPSLECIVVERTSFDKKGCEMAGCFPSKISAYLANSTIRYSGHK